MPCLAISDLIFSAALSVISIIGTIHNAQFTMLNAQRDAPWPAWALGIGHWKLSIGHSSSSRGGLCVRAGGHAALFVLLLLVVGNRRLDGVLSQHRAVNLHRWQRELGHDVGVLDRQRLID